MPISFSEALAIRPGDTCLSIASGGDNSLAMLSRGPERVIALDLNPAQIACLELRVAAYRTARARELLELHGLPPESPPRASSIAAASRSVGRRPRFWDAHPDAIAGGIGAAGKFERYFPPVPPPGPAAASTRGRASRDSCWAARRRRARRSTTREWDTWRWRLLFRVFFSRLMHGPSGSRSQLLPLRRGDVAVGSWPAPDTP